MPITTQKKTRSKVLTTSIFIRVSWKDVQRIAKQHYDITLTKAASCAFLEATEELIFKWFDINSESCLREAIKRAFVANEIAKTHFDSSDILTTEPTTRKE